MSKMGVLELVQLIDNIKCQALLIANEKYTAAGAVFASDVQREKEKRDAGGAIEGLCRSINYKIRVLSYKLKTIKSFDWGLFHNFSLRQEENREKVPSDEKVLVAQKLSEGEIVFACATQDLMEKFIVSEIATFFSNISGVIDNLSLIIDKAFVLRLGEGALLWRVAKELEEGALKKRLEYYAGENYSFWKMRDVRNCIEHRALNQVLIYPTQPSFADKNVGSLYVSDRIVNLENVDLRIDLYCEFIHSKLCDFLKEISDSISSTR